MVVYSLCKLLTYNSIHIMHNSPNLLLCALSLSVRSCSVACNINTCASHKYANKSEWLWHRVLVHSLSFVFSVTQRADRSIEIFSFSFQPRRSLSNGFKWWLYESHVPGICARTNPNKHSSQCLFISFCSPSHTALFTLEQIHFFSLKFQLNFYISLSLVFERIFSWC